MPDNYNVAITLTATDKTSNAVGQVNREMETLKTNVEQTGGIFDGLGSTIQGALGGLTVGAAIGVIGNLGEMGREAGVAEDAFRKMAGGIGDAQSVMEGLVGAGGGLIDDTDLYREGAKLLSSQAITTSGDLKTLVTDGVTLGSTFKGSASQGIEALGDAIERMNYRGLAQLGISIPNTKARVEELVAAGMDLQAAFRQAALEQASAAAEKFGGAAGIAFSATQRLTVQLGDLKDQLGEFVASGIEAGGQIVFILKAQSDAQGSALQASITKQQDAATMMTNLWANTSTQVLMHQSMIGGDLQTTQADALGFFQQLQTAALMYTQEMGKAPATVEDLTSEYIKLNGENVILTKSEEQAIRLFINYRDIVAQQVRMSENEMRGAATAAAMWRGEMSNIAASSQQISQTLADNAAKAQYSGPLGNMSQAEQQLGGMIAEAKSFDGLRILSPDEMARVETLHGQFQASYDVAVQLHDAKILPDSLFDGLKDWKTEQDALYKQAQGMSKNYEDIAGSLDKIAGLGAQGPGDQLSQQIEDKVAAAMKANGASDKSIADYTSRTDFTNGRNTPLNQTINDQVIGAIAQITQQNGGTAGAVATERAQQALDQLVQQGASPEQIEAAIKEGVVTGFKATSGGGSTYTVKPGDTPAKIAREQGMTIQEVMQAFGITNPRMLQIGASMGTGGGGFTPIGEMFGPTMNGATGGSTGPNWLGAAQGLGGGMGGQTGAPIDFSQMATQTGEISTNVLSQRDAWLAINGYVDTTRSNVATMADNSAPALATSAGDIATQMGTAQEKSQKMSDLITGLTKTKQVVNVELHVTDPSGLLKYAAGLDQKGMAKVVNANGGVVPGSDARRN